ncbi:MAG: GGDEF domain-containing protein [Burkholderiaceae bacterium]|nr:GGDEF domain-containing protein [Burkholderiaceae bacterium]
MEQICTFGACSTTIDDLQLFRGAADPYVASMLTNCPVVSVACGERVDDGSRERLFIVLSGQLEIGADARSGGEDGGTRILPGESAGEQAVIDDSAELATMTALEDSELLVIDSVTVWALMERSHALSLNLLRLLSFRIRAANALAQRRQKLGNFYRQLSLNDALTGLYNRAWLNDMLPKLAARAAQDGGSLSLVMVDLDHFKRFNDTHGHVAGDAALIAAASALRDGLRPSDFAVRYGGEEMMVILPGTSLDQAVMVAQRLCESLREAVVFADMCLPLPHVTGSFGVASLAPGAGERALM